MDCSPPDFSVHGISQAKTLEWVPFPTPGHLPNPGIEPVSPALAGRLFTTEPPGKPYMDIPHAFFFFFLSFFHSLVDGHLGSFFSS